MTAVPAFGAVDATGCPTMARTLFGVGSIAKAFTRLFLSDATEQGDVAGTHTPSVGRLGSLSHRLRLVRDAARWAPWWHNGGIGGFRSMVALDRTAGYGVVVLANVVLAPAKRIVSAWALLASPRAD